MKIYLLCNVATVFQNFFSTPKHIANIATQHNSSVHIHDQREDKQRFQMTTVLNQASNISVWYTIQAHLLYALRKVELVNRKRKTSCRPGKKMVISGGYFSCYHCK